MSASAASPASQRKDDSQVVSAAKNKIYNDTDQAWTYEGHWSKKDNRRAYDKQIHLSDTVEDSATISITGAGFTLVYSVEQDYGELQVFVDDVQIHTINQKKSKTSHQKEWTSPELADGTHLLKFVHASGKSVNIDAIKVRGPKSNSKPTSQPNIPATVTPLPTEIINPTQSPIPTEHPILEGTPTATNSVPSEVPTATSLPTLDSSPTAVDVVPPSSTPTPSLVPSLTASPTQLPTNTAIFTPTNTATLMPSVTATNTSTLPQTSGRIYYVALTGSDTNPGTQTQPFRTLQKGISAVNAGETVYVRAGIYQETVSINKSGSASSPITISSYPNEQAIIDGNNTLPGSKYAKLISVSGSYIVFKNFEVRNSNGRGIQVGGSYNLVTGNNVHHIWNIGIYIIGNNITVENNRVWRAADSNYTRDNGDWASGIVWGAAHSPNAAPNAVIRRNLVYQNSGQGIICIYTDSGLVDGNIVYDNWAMNIYVDQCSNITIKNNLIYYTADKQFWRSSTSPKGGIVLANEGIQAYPIGHDRKIINNILINNGTNIGFWIGKAAGAALINDLIANNTLVNAYTTGIGIDSAPHRQTRIINNIVLQARGKAASVAGGGITFSNNLWYPLNGVIGPGDVRQDPNLLNPDAPILAGAVDPHWYIFKDSSSPAINAGATMTSIINDFDGASRPSGPQYDIGAYEYR